MLLRRDLRIRSIRHLHSVLASGLGKKGEESICLLSPGQAGLQVGPMLRPPREPRSNFVNYVY
jgi:hypothetical protein